jgi:hypothetical protein
MQRKRCSRNFMAWGIAATTRLDSSGGASCCVRLSDFEDVCDAFNSFHHVMLCGHLWTSHRNFAAQSVPSCVISLKS